MFKKARIKLTVWYLIIIMAVSFSFSVIIYTGINKELVRIQNFQKAKILRIIGGRPGVFEVPLSQPDLDAIQEARSKIIFTLGLLNFSILVLSGVGGYFLAGRTLEPIAEMVEEQKQFIGNASHELRTPLTSIKTEIEVSLRDKKLTLLEAKKLLTSNLEEVNKMQNLSNYLLELNRYESGKELAMTKVDLKSIVLEAAGKMKIKKDLHKSLVTGNNDALVELVKILLDNAFKYGGKNPEVSVKVASKTIEVSDNGVGISSVDMPHIFERFYRADTSRSKEKVGGYGLGLPIADSIARIHGAKISVASKVGSGTTFRVEF